jgi:hypothetical protein
MARLVGTLQLDAGSVEDQHISSGTKIDADKAQHLYRAWTNFDLAIGGTPVAREEIVHVCEVAGTIRQFAALCNDTGTAASVTFDLKKNGTTVLSSVVTITNATADRAVVDGTLSSTSVAVGDVLSIALAVSTSTGMQGPFAWCTIEENGAP